LLKSPFHEERKKTKTARGRLTPPSSRPVV
jgi:hypothetical protein